MRTGKNPLSRALHGLPRDVQHRLGLIGLTLLLTVVVASLVGQFFVFVVGM